MPKDPAKICAMGQCRRMLCAALLLLLSSLPAAGQTPHTHDHRFTGAAHWAKIFDDPERDAWQKPHEVIRALQFKPDAVIADIGAGTGYFTARLAHMTPKGRVYAVDAEAEMTQYLNERTKREGMRNVQVLLARPGDPGLPEAADLILFVNVYHHIEDRTVYFRRLRTSLKDGGRLVVIDFRPDSPVGPPRTARVDAGQVAAELGKAGFRVTESHDFLPHQHFQVFVPDRR